MFNLKILADEKLSSGCLKFVYNYYNPVLACYFVKDSGKSKFLSGENAAPPLNFAAPHFAAPHEYIAATPLKIAAPGRQKPETSLPGTICKNTL